VCHVCQIRVNKQTNKQTNEQTNERTNKVQLKAALRSLKIKIKGESLRSTKSQKDGPNLTAFLAAKAALGIVC